ncbi:hypothetical protein XA68_15367 [Ophiocordyceps unilateralis]|uniref:Uncharacterized protein n=1 Tax=Ophiocordyceps unilateralis TaxID=268505 RepID=A0A2A9PLE9_OPHUN|nr:hypothetical protein XA68_15367 [Ophiocordyceps unilateralis]
MAMKSVIERVACLILLCPKGVPTIAELRYRTFTAKEASRILDNLIVKIGPAASAPAVVRVFVHNNNTDAVTFMKDYSPLDPLALRLGMFNITPAYSPHPIKLPVVEVRREWPPDLRSLVTIQPGSTVTSDLNLHDLEMDFSRFENSASAVLFGDWLAVWKVSRVVKDLFRLENWGSIGGKFVSNHIMVNLSNI